MHTVAVCRELASRARFGALATLTREPPGFPFATLVAVAIDGGGSARPLFFLSSLAEHTKNLADDGRASLLVCEASDDPLAAGRMTLVGVCARVPPAEVESARSAFLAVHPEAIAYASLPDFAPWRLEVTSVRWIGGFGRMTWIDGADYARGA